MHITEQDVTGPIARKLRDDAGLTQAAFWRPLGVQQSVGSRYETDIPIPHAVRILLVARYVAGMRIDAGNVEGVADLIRLGAIQSKQAQSKSIVAHARADMTRAIKNLETARDALQSL
jgi:predicted transcriptional regulator